MGQNTPHYDIYPDPVYGYIDFVGGLFSWGLAAGSAVHFIKGLRSSPSGARLVGAVNAVRQNAPRVAGRYCIVFSIMENAAALSLRRDDTLSGGAAAAATGGIYGMHRGGAPAAARCALLGGTGFMALYLAMDVAEKVLWDCLYYQKQMKRGQVALPAVVRPASHRRLPEWLKMSPSCTREKSAASLF